MFWDYNNELISFQEKLEACLKIDNINNCFIEHASSDFLKQFFKETLTKVAANPQIVIGNILSKNSFRFINNERFTYTVSLIKNQQFYPAPEWSGNNQSIYISGNGKCILNIYKVDDDININTFKKGVKITLKEKILQPDDYYYTKDNKEFFEVKEVRGELILQLFKIHNQKSKITWLFNADLCSYASKFPGISISTQIHMLIDLAVETEVNVPQKIYDYIDASNDYSLHLHALKALLIEGHPEAEKKLLAAVSSENIWYATAAKDLLDKLS